MLRTHPNEVQQVEVREWYSCDKIEVVNKGEPSIEFAQVDSIAQSCHSPRKFVPLYFTLEELLYVEDVETPAFLLQILLFRLPIIAPSINDHILVNGVANCVEVALVHIEAAHDV